MTVSRVRKRTVWNLLKWNLWFIKSEMLYLIFRGPVAKQSQTLKDNCWRAGNCSFLGPAEFLDKSAKAMEMLSSLDEQLFKSVVAFKFVFWYEPKGNVMLKMHSGISPDYLIPDAPGALRRARVRRPEVGDGKTIGPGWFRLEEGNTAHVNPTTRPCSWSLAELEGRPCPRILYCLRQTDPDKRVVHDKGLPGARIPQ